MIDRLKKQQEKLLIAERFSAWENIARKLAHEIKNPLTPIQLSIDRLKEKYSKQINENQSDFTNYLETINRQIKDIEKLANEFSNFARMPRPNVKKMNIYGVLERVLDLIKPSSKNKIELKTSNKQVLIMGDQDQLYRAILNLIKNSEEAIEEKRDKNPDIKGKISIELNINNDYIEIIISDNGIGIDDNKKVMAPYFTTKKNGTGLGLPIVEKIISEHGGELKLAKSDDKTKISFTLPLIN